MSFDHSNRTHHDNMNLHTHINTQKTTTTTSAPAAAVALAVATALKPVAEPANKPRRDCEKAIYIHLANHNESQWDRIERDTEFM